MTKEEKIARIIELLLISGNTAKLIRAFVAESLPVVPEEKIDEIIQLLEAE